ncbi:MAG: calcium-binding protein [Alphaproteobacteria bacterium]|nr:calcium-binding protein [Alphaproteobacteria bacterium]
MKRLHFATISIAAFLISGAAVAQNFPGPPPMEAGPHGGFSLLRFDANNDGKVTRAEVSTAEKSRFAEADANKDGFVTPDEMRTAMRKHMLEARFARLDADHNGQISLAEFEKAMPEGRGPSPGFAGHRGFRGPEMARIRDHDGPRGSRDAGGRKPGPDADSNDAPKVRRMGPADANGDGKLSYEEFSARSLAAFDRADTDKNGIVTIAELRAASGVTK